MRLDTDHIDVMKYTADVIVAGLGAMGSAALYQLAKKGIKAIGIDQFRPPHAFGSSHGETRIVRQVTGQAIEYTPLALRAYEIWRELEEEAKRNLLTITGGLIVEAEDSLSARKKSEYLPAIKQAAEKYGIAHDILSNADLTKRFPQFRFPNNERGYYEYGAGYARPELCIETHLALAVQRGAETRYDERVLKFAAATGSGVTITTDKDDYEAGKLVVAAGPWISELLPAYARLFRVCRQVQYWFDIPGNIRPYEPGSFPVFIFELADSTGFYGFPAVDGPQGGLKLAGENYDIATTPQEVDRVVSEEETRAIYEKFVRPYLPGLSDRCVKAKTCLYTLTPDYHFVIDLVPAYPQIIMASPCSGHGFKYSAAIGEYLADLAVGRETNVNLDKFKLSRLTSKDPSLDLLPGTIAKRAPK
jgi:sarcosine oxidase